MGLYGGTKFFLYTDLIILKSRKADEISSFCVADVLGVKISLPSF